MAISLGNILSGFVGGLIPGALTNPSGREFLLGKPQQQLPNLSKEQQDLLNQLLTMLTSGQVGEGQQQATSLSQQYLNPESEATQQFAEPYLRAFQEQTIPQIAERFAAKSPMGGGALSSSGFGQALSSASGQLQSTLAALKSELGKQAAQQLMDQYSNLANLGLGKQPFSYQAGTPGALTQFLSGYAQSGFPGLV